MYNSSKNEISKNMKRHIDYCNSQDLKNPKIDPRQAKWSGDLSDKLARLGSKPAFNKSLIRTALYRPFFKQYVYFEEKTFINSVYRIPLFFPTAHSENLVICVPYKFTGNFSTFITDITPDLEVVHHGQGFPLYTYHNGKSRTTLQISL